MITLSKIYDLVIKGGTAPVYLPKNFLRTGFGVRAHPYLTVRDELPEYPLLQEVKEEIFSGFLNPFTRADSMSVISTPHASAMEFEYRTPFSGDNAFAIFAIADCSLEKFMTETRPVRFLMTGSYEAEGLRVQKILVPETPDKRNLQKLEISNFEVQRALFYADLCMDQLGNGGKLLVERNMDITSKAAPSMLELNFNDMKWARQVNEARFISPSNTYS